MPAILQSLKPAIVQNRPQVERDYDAILPFLIESMNARLNEYIEGVAAAYARAFTAEELREVVAFYRGPTGQKFVQRTPLITQEILIFGQRLGQSIGAGMIEELRKRGHDIRILTMPSGSILPTVPVGALISALPTKNLRTGDIVTFYLPKDKSTTI